MPLVAVGISCAVLAFALALRLVVLLVRAEVLRRRPARPEEVPDLRPRARELRRL